MTFAVRSLIACTILVSVTGPVFAQGASDALMRLLRSGKLPDERLPSVVEMVGRRGDASDLAYLFEQVTKEDGWKGAAATAALEGLIDAATNRKLTPEGDLSRLSELFESDQTAIRERAIRLAGLWRIPELLDPLESLVLARDASHASRSAALESLASYGAAGRSTIESVASADEPLAITAPAIAALAGLDVNAAAKYAAVALAKAKPQDDPGPVLGAFLDRQGGPAALATALAGVKLPPDVAKAALRSMYSVGRSDAALSSALGQAAGIAMEDKPFTPEEIQQLAAAVQTEGDPARGELVFRRADLSCQKCHSVSGAGGNIGPDLSAIGPSNPIDYLVTSILEPDAAVKEHYATQIVITSDGLVVTGIVADENDNRIVLRTAEGNDRSIPKADIEAREKGSSLMPKGLIKFMTRQELLDLVRFLSELGKPRTPYALRSRPTVQRWRVLAQLPESFTKGIPSEAVFRKDAPPIDDSVWQPVYSRVDGTLPLSELTGGGKQPVYLLAEVDVRKGGAVGLRFDSLEGLDLWVNGDHIDSLSRNFTTEFTEGRQSFAIRVDPAKRSTATLRAEVFVPRISTAEAEVVGGV